jgi:hypothetical protein
MGSRQIVLVSTAGFSVLNTGIFWREAKTKKAFFTVLPLEVPAVSLIIDTQFQLYTIVSTNKQRLMALKFT